MHNIKVENLTKTFKYYRKEKGIYGSIRNLFYRESFEKCAVNNVSFSIKEGEVVALLGANGAGKTTILKILSGILHPTFGEIHVSNYVPYERKNEYKKLFSIVMGQKNQLWWDLPANETFLMNKYIYEISDEEYNTTLEELTELLDVKHLLEVQVRRLSLGERMKMEIIAALIHRPKILFLDEPTIGLDITSQRKIRNFLKYYNQKTKTTIILTSHYTKDIEELCKRAIIINQGNIVYDGELDQINDVLGEKKLLNIRCKYNIEKELISNYGLIKEYGGDYATIEIEKNNITKYSSELIRILEIEDFTITDIPIEEGIEKFYRKELSEVR